MKLQKLIALILSLLMLAALFNGCKQSGTSTTTSDATAATTSNSTAEEPSEYDGTMPISKEPVHLSVYTHSGAAANYLPPDNSLLYYKETQNATNVIIDWEVVSREGYDEIIKTKLASGAKMPDIMNMRTTSALESAIRSGIAVELDSLIDKYGYYIKKWWSEGFDYARELWKYSDGKIHALYGWVVPDYGQVGPMYNKLWLEKLNMEVPTTLEEFKTLVYAMKEYGDFNGNGKNDEIIVTGDNLNNFNHFSSTWGLHICHGGNGWQANNGVVTCDFVDDRYKEFLQFCNQLYEDGILDKELITNNYNKMYEKVAADRVGIVWGYSTFADTYGDLTSQGTANPGTQIYIPGLPLKGPYGDQFLISKITKGSEPTVITKDCKNPEIAMKWLDYILCSKDNIKLRYFGIEGEHHTIDEKGNIKPIEPTDGTTYNDMIISFGGSQIPLCHLQSVERLYIVLKDWVIAADEARLPYYKQTLLPTAWTEEEQEIVDAYYKDITTYFSEMEGKFIMSEESFDNWGKYIETMKGLHINDVQKAYQSRYDRSLNSK